MNNNLKRVLSGVLALTMAGSMMTGCGSSTEKEAESTTPAATTPSTTTPAPEATTDANPYAELVEALGDDKTVRLATPGNYAPFTIYDEATKTWDGFEIELWQVMTEKAGLELELVQLDNPATFAELDLGRVDTVAKQISITPARQEKYDFTQPFFFSPYCLTVPEDNTTITSWADMEGKSIALAEGSAMNEFVAERDPDNKVQKNVYESSGVILQQVMMGRADAAPWAYLVLPYTMEKNPELKLKSVAVDDPIYTEVNAYPFARTERGAVMLELIDTVLGDMIADGSYSELCTEWFGLDVMETQPAKDYFAAQGETPVADANTDKYSALVEKLGDDKTIRLATPGNYAPFTIYDEASKTWDGFEIELWQIISEKVGMELELVQIDNPATFAELDLGRVDTVAKQISITPARQEKYDFTQPFFFSPYCLTVPEDNTTITSWADMEGKSIALAEGSAMNEFVAERDPDNKVQKNVYESSGVILQQVMMGRADAAPWAYLVLPYTMEKNPELKLKSVAVDDPIYTEVNAYPFARTERGAVMLELIDTVLGDMIADGSYSELCTEWFGLDVMETQPAKDYFAANPKN